MKRKGSQFNLNHGNIGPILDIAQKKSALLRRNNERVRERFEQVAANQNSLPSLHSVPGLQGTAIRVPSTKQTKLESAAMRQPSPNRKTMTQDSLGVRSLGAPTLKLQGSQRDAEATEREVSTQHNEVGIQPNSGARAELTDEAGKFGSESAVYTNTIKFDSLSDKLVGIIGINMAPVHGKRRDSIGHMLSSDSLIEDKSLQETLQECIISRQYGLNNHKTPEATLNSHSHKDTELCESKANTNTRPLSVSNEVIALPQDVAGQSPVTLPSVDEKSKVGAEAQPQQAAIALEPAKTYDQGNPRTVVIYDSRQEVGRYLSNQRASNSSLESHRPVGIKNITIRSDRNRQALRRKSASTLGESSLATKSHYGGVNADSPELQLLTANEDTNCEASASKALSDYLHVKQKLNKARQRVYNDDKIATLDQATEKRANLVGRLLGGSKEALDIQNKFRKMVEVPQEDFNIKTFKDLQVELDLKVKRPAAVYEKQKWLNPKHTKNFSVIEDFVTVLPTTSTVESAYQPTLGEASRCDTNFQSKDIPNSALKYQEIVGAIGGSRKYPMLDHSVDSSSQKRLTGSKQKLFAIASEYEVGSRKNSDIGAAIQTEEATFITTMADDIDYTNLPSQEPTQRLPLIPNKKSQALVVLPEAKRPSASRIGHLPNEYPFKSAVDLRKRNSVAESSLEKSLSCPQSKVSLHEQRGSDTHRAEEGSLPNVSSSLALMQYQKTFERQSELSFKIGKRSVGELLSTDRQQFRHSKLESVLGRESRVLQRIYQRVDHLAQREGQGSQLGHFASAAIPQKSQYIPGLQSIKGNKKHPKSTQRKKLQKKIQAPQPIVRAGSPYVDDKSSSMYFSQEPISIPPQPADGTMDQCKRTQNSIKSLFDTKKLSSQVATSNAASAKNLAPVSQEVLQQQQQLALSIGSSEEAVRSTLKPWEDTTQAADILSLRRPSLDGSNLIDFSNRIKKMDESRETELAKGKIFGKSALKAYKQQRELVSNQQLNQIIKKDKNVFAVAKKQHKLGKLSLTKKIIKPRKSSVTTQQKPLLPRDTSGEKSQNVTPQVQDGAQAVKSKSLLQLVKHAVDSRIAAAQTKNSQSPQFRRIDQLNQSNVQELKIRIGVPDRSQQLNLQNNVSPNTQYQLVDYDALLGQLHLVSEPSASTENRTNNSQAKIATEQSQFIAIAANNDSQCASGASTHGLITPVRAAQSQAMLPEKVRQQAEIHEYYRHLNQLQRLTQQNVSEIAVQGRAMEKSVRRSSSGEKQFSVEMKDEATEPSPTVLEEGEDECGGGEIQKLDASDKDQKSHQPINVYVDPSKLMSANSQTDGWMADAKGNPHTLSQSRLGESMERESAISGRGRSVSTSSFMPPAQHRRNQSNENLLRSSEIIDSANLLGGAMMLQEQKGRETQTNMNSSVVSKGKQLSSPAKQLSQEQKMRSSQPDASSIEIYGSQAGTHQFQAIYEEPQNDYPVNKQTSTAKKKNPSPKSQLKNTDFMLGQLPKSKQPKNVSPFEQRAKKKVRRAATVDGFQIAASPRNDTVRKNQLIFQSNQSRVLRPQAVGEAARVATQPEPITVLNVNTRTSASYLEEVRIADSSRKSNAKASNANPNPGSPQLRQPHVMSQVTMDAHMNIREINTISSAVYDTQTRREKPKFKYSDKKKTTAVKNSTATMNSNEASAMKQVHKFKENSHTSNFNNTVSQASGFDAAGSPARQKDIQSVIEMTKVNVEMTEKKEPSQATSDELTYTQLDPKHASGGTMIDTQDLKPYYQATGMSGSKLSDDVVAMAQSVVQEQPPQSLHLTASSLKKLQAQSTMSPRRSGKRGSAYGSSARGSIDLQNNADLMPVIQDQQPDLQEPYH